MPPAEGTWLYSERATPFDVFVSYSSKNKAAADQIVHGLESRGIRCWVAPRDIASGANWGEAIIRGIESSRALLLVLSRHSNASQQILQEVERAVSKGLVIVPIRIEEVAVSPRLELYVGARHWLDAFSLPLEQHLAQLASDLHRILDAPESIARPSAPGASATSAAGKRVRGRKPLALAVALTLVVTAASWLFLQDESSSDSGEGTGGPGTARAGYVEARDGTTPSRAESPLRALSFFPELERLARERLDTRGEDAGTSALDTALLERLATTTVEGVTFSAGEDLSQVLKRLLEPIGVEYSIDSSLEYAWVPREVRLSHPVSTGAALDAVMYLARLPEAFGLDNWFVQDGVVTTVRPGKPIVEVYLCGDILGNASRGIGDVVPDVREGVAVDLGYLAYVIQKSIEPDTEISPAANCSLVIGQTPSVHRKIAALLTSLRKCLVLEDCPEPSWKLAEEARAWSAGDEEAMVQLRRVPVSCAVSELAKDPVGVLEQIAGRNVIVNADLDSDDRLVEWLLGEESGRLPERVTGPWEQVIQCPYLVQSGILWLGNAPLATELRTYRVWDLVEASLVGIRDVTTSIYPAGEPQEDLEVEPLATREHYSMSADEFEDLVTSFVAPESWEADPRLEINVLKGILIVRAYPEMHRRIEELLDRLRR